MSIWDTIDELLDDKDAGLSSSNQNHDSNEDELDQNELLGIIEEDSNENFAYEFGLSSHSNAKQQQENKYDAKLEEENKEKQAVIEEEELDYDEEIDQQTNQETNQANREEFNQEHVESTEIVFENQYTTEESEQVHLDLEINNFNYEDDVVEKIEESFSSTNTNDKNNSLAIGQAEKNVQVKKEIISSDVISNKSTAVGKVSTTSLSSSGIEHENASNIKRGEVDEEEEDEEDEDEKKLRGRSAHWSERNPNSKNNNKSQDNEQIQNNYKNNNNNRRNNLNSRNSNNNYNNTSNNNFQPIRNNKHQQRYDNNNKTNNNNNNNNNNNSNSNNINNNNFSTRGINNSHLGNMSSQLMPHIVPQLLPTHHNLPPQTNNFSMFPNGIMNINQPLDKQIDGGNGLLPLPFPTSLISNSSVPSLLNENLSINHHNHPHHQQQQQQTNMTYHPPFNNLNSNQVSMASLNQPQGMPNFHNINNNNNNQHHHNVVTQPTLIPPTLIQQSQTHPLNNQQLFMPQQHLSSTTLRPQSHSQPFYNNNANNQHFNNNNSINPGNFMHKNLYDESIETGFSHSFMQPSSLNQFNNNIFNGNQYQQFNNSQPMPHPLHPQQQLQQQQVGPLFPRSHHSVMPDHFKNHSFNNEQMVSVLPFQNINNQQMQGLPLNSNIHQSNMQSVPHMSQRNVNNNPVSNVSLQNQNPSNQLLKPSTIYINPSFIPKQQQLQNKQHSQIENVPVDKLNRLKDLELLLEKRLAEERAIESNQQKQKASSTGSTKRKSNEHSTSKSNTPSPSKKSESSNLINKKKQETSPIKRDHTPDIHPPAKKVMSSPYKSKIKSIVTTQMTAPSSGVIVIDDPDYSKKLEEQKRKREEMLRLKEEKRNQRILEASKASTNSKQINQENTVAKTSASTRTVIATNEIIIPNLAVSASSPTKVNRIVTKTNTPIQFKSSVKHQQENESPLTAKRLIIQNLSLNTTDKNIISMCNSINLKDKVKTNKIFISF